MKKYKYAISLLAMAILLFMAVTLTGCKAEHTDTTEQTQVTEVPDSLQVSYDDSELDTSYDDLDDIDSDLGDLNQDFE